MAEILFAEAVDSTTMRVRWNYEGEFRWLARLAGLRVVALRSGFERAPRARPSMPLAAGHPHSGPVFHGAGPHHS